MTVLSNILLWGAVALVWLESVALILAILYIRARYKQLKRSAKNMLSFGNAALWILKRLRKK